MTLRTRLGEMRSRPSGWVGAARIESDGSKRVSRVCSIEKSRCSSDSAASAMVC